LIAGGAEGARPGTAPSGTDGRPRPAPAIPSRRRARMCLVAATSTSEAKDLEPGLPQADLSSPLIASAAEQAKHQESPK